MIIALTNEDYYNILLQGYNEALTIYEAKEFLSTDEGIEDSQTTGQVLYSDEFKKQLGERTIKDLTSRKKKKKEIGIYFLNFLDRQKKKIKKEQLIERSYFYKRCLLSLNVKLLEYNKKGNRILRGLNDMGTHLKPLEFFEYHKHHIKFRSQQIEIVKPLGGIVLKTDYTKQKTFKMGLKFATGEAQELYKKYKEDKGHFKKICLELGFEETSRPYFSDTLPNNIKASKNLYKNKNLVIQIYNHCIDNNIVMCKEFLSKYTEIEHK